MTRINLLTYVTSVVVLTFHLATVTQAATPQPFRVYWNYPDQKCTKSGFPLDKKSYNIDANEEKFLGDVISIFYSRKAGKWPYIDFTDNDTEHYGGLPMNVDMPGHRSSLTSAVEKVISPGASSPVGVIDMENWRPVLNTNWGRFTNYKAIFTKLVEDKNPGLSYRDLKRLASAEWKKDALPLMVESLKAVKKARPQGLWGYYGYPEYVSRKYNKDIPELWQEVTAYYPSIYIKTQAQGVDQTVLHIKDVIAEAYRVRAEYGNPSDPLYPYTVVQFRKLGMFTGEWLKAAFQVPIEMGVDGLILWASSNELMPPKTKCPGVKEYLTTTLGPMIKGEMDRMTQCSEQLCAGRGRCVKKAYAQQYRYLRTRGVSEVLLSSAVASGLSAVDLSSVEEEFREDFVCQCYQGAAGDRCTDSYTIPE